MNRIADEPTPAKRLTALAIAVFWNKFNEYRLKQNKSISSLDIQEFIDYADLEVYMDVVFQREELLIRLDEGKKAQDRYRKHSLEDRLVEALKRVNDLNL